MQTILALLEVVKTTAAICASDKLEEKNKLLASDIMHTCLDIVKTDMDELTIAHREAQKKK